jgi:hypothetical protein
MYRRRPDRSATRSASAALCPAVTRTLVGGASFVPGKKNNAVSLDGSTGYVSPPAGLICSLSAPTAEQVAALAPSWRISGFQRAELGDIDGELGPCTSRTHRRFAKASTSLMSALIVEQVKRHCQRQPNVVDHEFACNGGQFKPPLCPDRLPAAPPAHVRSSRA